MARLKLRGKFVAISEPKEMGQNKTMVQNVHLLVPGYVDEFGDKKGNDEVWEFSVIGDNISKLALSESLILKKADVKIYLNSNTLPKTETRPELYIINCVLASYELIP